MHSPRLLGPQRPTNAEKRQEKREKNNFYPLNYLQTGAHSYFWPGCNLGSQHLRRHGGGGGSVAVMTKIPGGLCLYVLEMQKGKCLGYSLVNHNSSCCQGPHILAPPWESFQSRFDGSSQTPQKDLLSKENAKFGTKEGSLQHQ